MNDVFKSLNIILKGEDRSKFFFASTILFFVVLIEVFGLGLISFLIINVSDLSKAISNTSFLKLMKTTNDKAIAN